jgi:DNA-binding NtrC family response regulator
VLTDLAMPGIDGLELIRRIRAMPEPAIVLVTTASGAVQSAVEAMRAGAADYLTKPIDLEELSRSLERMVERRRLTAEVRESRVRFDARDDIIGSSPPMKRLLGLVEQVAPSRATVLITGASGTGKELVAGAIHRRSPRADGPFVKVHCAALAETLLESELFGHEKGSFTGAVARRDGRFAAADGGTLFLDEIGEISPAIQVKLLRFLQEHELEPVGGNRSIEVDVRVIAATNRDLRRMVEQGRFREDLYYRLDVVTLEMPSLTDRRSDIPVLAQAFFERFSRDNGRRLDGFSPATLEALARHDWPGNVRELENVVERAVVIARGLRIEPTDLPATLVSRAAGSSAVRGAPPIPGSPLHEIERHAILTTLEATGGSTSRAAAILGISVRKIQYKLHEYNDAPRSAIEAVDASSRAR